MSKTREGARKISLTQDTSFQIKRNAGTNVPPKESSSTSGKKGLKLQVELRGQGKMHLRPRSGVFPYG